MADKRCPVCDREWPETARRCTCGHRFDAEPDAVFEMNPTPPPDGSTERTKTEASLSIAGGCLATFALYFGLVGLGIGSRGPDATPGPWGPVFDFAVFWVPMMLITAAAYGHGFALWRGRKVGIVVAVAWIVLWLLLMVGTAVFE